MAGWIIPLIQGIVSAGQGQQSQNNSTKIKPVDLGAGYAGNEVVNSSGGGGGGFLSSLMSLYGGNPEKKKVKPEGEMV